jgi:transcriptional regulator with XRE-family HTH domain
MLGERLAGLRRASGITQAALAAGLGLSKSAVSMYESSSRRPDNETLMKIAAYFNVSADYLLGGEDAERGSFSGALARAKALGVTERELMLAIEFIVSAKNADKPKG